MLNKLLMGSALMLSCFCAGAKTKTIFQEAITAKTSEKMDRFFEIRGVQGQAIVKAWKKCRNKKNKKCVVRNIKTEHANLEQYNYSNDEFFYETKVTAVVKSIDGYKSVVKSKDTSSMAHYFDHKPSELEINGVLMASIESAMEMCELEDYDFCSLVDVKLIEKGRSFYDYSVGADRYSVKAEATVSGYNKLDKKLSEKEQEKYNEKYYSY